MKKVDMEKEIQKLKDEISELKSQILALSLRQPYTYYYWPIYTQPQPTYPTYPYVGPQVTWTTISGPIDATSGSTTTINMPPTTVS